MSRIIMRESGPLSGTVEISGAKNSVLPIMAATLLADGECELTDVPKLRDVDIMCKLLTSIGSHIETDYDNNTLRTLVGPNILGEVPFELVSKMRASILVMGPLLARIGKVKIALPGGCKIGARPIDLHLKGFKALGADIEYVNSDTDYLLASADKLKGAEIYLDFPSVGATENIMMAAVCAEGTSIIENVAQEPEIVDLANFLNQMGAKIKGAGTDTIKIEGVKRLEGAKHVVIPDRIEAGTFMLAAAISRGDVLITNIVPDHVRPVIAKLKECGVEISEEDDRIRVFCSTTNLKPTTIRTLPYPGFPTDIQSLFMAFLTSVEGKSIVVENVFENRYMHVEELNKMGAHIEVNGKSAIITGVDKLSGAKVAATDLRAGAALVLAGLVADGETEISEIYHVERGYDDIITKLKKLGANIKKV